MSKILINLIGKETIPNYHAYKEFQPDILIQVYSDFSKKASNILASMVDRDKTEVVLIECDGWNFIDLLEKLKSSIKLQPNDQLFVNVTGGTKMMALPVYEFAKDQSTDVEVKLFYTTTNSEIVWFLEKDQVTSLQTILSIQELISLQDQKLKSKISHQEALAQFEKPLNVIKTEWDSKYSRWNQFLKILKKLYRKPDDEVPVSFDSFIENINSSQEVFKITQTEKGIYLNYKDTIFLKFGLNSENTLWFLLNGGWFEGLVAQKLVLKYPSYEVYLNVNFNFKTDERRIKNEVDILMSDGNKLLFFECKSGIIKSKDIDSIKIRNDIYGGLIGKSVLIGRYPFSSSSKILAEKAEDYGIPFMLYNDL
jgi:hypothetical protein